MMLGCLKVVLKSGSTLDQFAFHFECAQQSGVYEAFKYHEKANNNGRVTTMTITYSTLFPPFVIVPKPTYEYSSSSLLKVGATPIITVRPATQRELLYYDHIKLAVAMTHKGGKYKAIGFEIWR